MKRTETETTDDGPWIDANGSPAASSQKQTHVPSFVLVDRISDGSLVLFPRHSSLYIFTLNPTTVRLRVTATSVHLAHHLWIELFLIPRTACVPIVRVLAVRLAWRWNLWCVRRRPRGVVCTWLGVFHVYFTFWQPLSYIRGSARSGCNFKQVHVHTSHAIRKVG